MPDQIETGLALFEGSYRAMLFNLGSVWPPRAMPLSAYPLGAA